MPADSPKNIVLIGYRGTGKTPTGRRLAAETGYDLVCMDAEIERRAGCPIAEFVAQHGWDRFRDLEADVARDAGALEGAVIDTGGGVVLRPENIAALRSKGVIFWLTADVETIAARISGDSNRPSLTGDKSIVDEIADVLEQRTPLYEKAADHVISTIDCAEEAIAEAVLAIWSRLEIPGTGPSSQH